VSDQVECNRRRSTHVSDRASIGRGTITAISRTANGVDATFTDACVLKTELGDAYGEQQKHSSCEPSGSEAGIPGGDQTGDSFSWDVTTVKLSLGSTLL
jgi:hypothetical protein